MYFYPYTSPLLLFEFLHASVEGDPTTNVLMKRLKLIPIPEIKPIYSTSESNNPQADHYFSTFES